MILILSQSCCFKMHDIFMDGLSNVKSWNETYIDRYLRYILLICIYTDDD